MLHGKIKGVKKILKNKERFFEIKKRNELKKLPEFNSALFLDRDGVMIRDIGYISNADDVILELGLKKLISRANELNIPIFVVTNQSGISRGFYNWSDFEKVNNRMLNLIGEPSSIIAIYANSYKNLSKNNWRKPNPEMILSASKKYNINIDTSFLIGDRLSDMIAGCKSGIKTLVHVKTGHGKNEYATIKNSCDDDFFYIDNKKSKIIFIDNLLKFPFEVFD